MKSLYVLSALSIMAFLSIFSQLFATLDNRLEYAKQAHLPTAANVVTQTIRDKEKPQAYAPREHITLAPRNLVSDLLAR